VLKKIENEYMHKRNHIELSLQIKNEPGQLARTLHILGEAGALIKDVMIEGDDSAWLDVTVIVASAPDLTYETLAGKLAGAEGIIVREIDIE